MYLYIIIGYHWILQNDSPENALEVPAFTHIVISENLGSKWTQKVWKDRCWLWQLSFGQTAQHCKCLAARSFWSPLTRFRSTIGHGRRQFWTWWTWSFALSWLFWWWWLASMSPKWPDPCSIPYKASALSWSPSSLEWLVSWSSWRFWHWSIAKPWGARRQGF